MLTLQVVEHKQDSEFIRHWHYVNTIDQDSDPERIRKVAESEADRKMFDSDTVRIVDNYGNVYAEV